MRSLRARALTMWIACAALAACDSGSTGPVGGTPLEFSSLSAGDVHTCGLTVDSLAFCWGSNGFGQLGDGTLVTRATPVAVMGGLRFAAITTGFHHTCALTRDRTAYCWGWNQHGQLGDGTTDGRTAPQPVSGGLQFSTLSAGSNYTCGVAGAGEAYCWGWNPEGNLGDGTRSVDRLTPTPVLGGLAFSLVTTDNDHTCGLTTSGSAYCWGDNGYAQIGVDSAGGRALEPVPVSIATGLAFEWIEAGRHDFTCAIASEDPYCWGHNDFGQLGRGFRSETEPDLGRLPGGIRLIAIEGSLFHACGVASDGSAYCWGLGSLGRLGYGGRDDRYTPVRVSGDWLFASVTVGSGHSCGLTTAGAALCWGWNESGQLGIGAPDDSRTTPQPVVGPVDSASP